MSTAARSARYIVANASPPGMFNDRRAASAVKAGGGQNPKITQIENIEHAVEANRRPDFMVPPQRLDHVNSLRKIFHPLRVAAMRVGASPARVPVTPESSGSFREQHDQ